MKTSKFIIDEAQSYQNRVDKKSYIPVTYYKNTINTSGKIHPEKR